MPSSVDINPDASILSVLRHLNYKPWYALGEFIDNSLQSFLTHRSSLQKINGEAVKLCVNIDIDATDPPRISIRDNAAGIHESKYKYAFRPAAIPPDRTGLAEFGMGMKCAACWFAPRWHVRTSALGEAFSRTVRFDIGQIVKENIEKLPISEIEEDINAHYTEIILESVFQIPKGRTVGKIKDHLAGMYRIFIRDGLLELRFNGKSLSYEEPAVLNAPYFKDRKGPEKNWRKDIAFDFGGGLSVRGFAAIRETGSTERAGFALFRRDRLIQGSGDEGYRPIQIFGRANSFRYQRIFGELHLKGFDVSHTKDGFRWDENEEAFLDLLKDELDQGELPLLKQAEKYRVREPDEEEPDEGTPDEEEPDEGMPDEGTPDEEEPGEEEPSERNEDERIEVFEFSHDGSAWKVTVTLTNDAAESDWIRTYSDTMESDGTRVLDVRVPSTHPFTVLFSSKELDSMEGLFRLAVAIALAEVTARDSGVGNAAGTVRRNINALLEKTLLT